MGARNGMWTGMEMGMRTEVSDVHVPMVRRSRIYPDFYKEYISYCGHDPR